MSRTTVKNTEPSIEIAAKVPRLYHVLLLNDDYTPREFVVDVLHRFFSMDEATAQAVMLQAHTRGMASCGVYIKDLAETKVMKIMDFIKEVELPLRFTAEPA